MDDFLGGRQCVEVYTVFFETFMPCATKKSTWVTQIARAGMEKENKKVVSLCTVNDKAFALLLLEKGSDHWVDLYKQCPGIAKQHRGSKDRGFQSEVPPRYTSGGIKYETNEVSQSFKGWSDEGRLCFNALFDHVKQHRRDNRSFEVDWLESRQEKEESSKQPQKEKHQAVMTRSELFDSDDDEEVQSTVDKNRETPADNSDNESKGEAVHRL